MSAPTPMPSPLRVAHVITRLIVGGAQENTIATVLGLRTQPGFSATLLAGPTTGPEGSLESIVRAVPGLFTRLDPLVRPIVPWQDARAWRALVRSFRQTQPHVVHTHSGKAGVLGRWAAHAARVPVIVHTIHGPSFGPFQGPLPNLLFRSAERSAARVTTHFVVVADAMRAQYLAAGIGRPDQYTRVPSGFDLDPFLAAATSAAWRSRFGFNPDHCVVGKIARLFRHKGHDDLIAIMPALVRACPAMRFLLVGDGVWRARFERKVRDLGLANHVVFAGLVPPTDVPHCVGAMDILVHLSRREGLPRALPQAMAAGKPVVAFDCDGAAEVCRDAETGFLVPPGDLPQLEERLTRLARNTDLRHQLGSAGQALVRREFGVDTMVLRLRDLYLDLARQAGLTGLPPDSTANPPPAMSHPTP